MLQLFIIPGCICIVDLKLSLFHHSQCRGTFSGHTEGSYWVGARQSAPLKPFQWLNNQAVDASEWFPGEPDNDGNTTCGCVQDSIRGLFARNCMNTQFYICQKGEHRYYYYKSSWCSITIGFYLETC